MLPKYCGNIVNIDKDNEKERKVSLRYNVLSRETLNVLSEDKGDKTKANDTDKLIEYKYFQNKYMFGPELFTWLVLDWMPVRTSLKPSCVRKEPCG